MRIPSRIVEHPIEAAIASLLLLALLLGSNELSGTKVPDAAATMAAQRL